MELRGGSDDDAARGKHEGNDQADGEIEDGEAAMVFPPAFFQHGVGEEEGHVDADGGAKGGHHDVALIGNDLGRPKISEASRGRDGIPEGVGWTSQNGKVGDESAKDAAPVERTTSGHRDDDAEEGEDDDADHDFEDGLKQLDAGIAALVEEIDGPGECKKNAADGDTCGAAVEAGHEILLNGGLTECELRHAPDDIGHEGGDDPGPTEDGADVIVDGFKRTGAGGKGDEGDGTQHDDAEDHGERLEPHHGVARNDAEVKRASERSASKGDRSLQPSGAGTFGVGTNAFAERQLDDLGQGLVFGTADGAELVVVIGGHADWDSWVGKIRPWGECGLLAMLVSALTLVSQPTQGKGV